MAVEKFFVITESMLNLDLSSRELIVYAIIYGFSQDGESWFYGGQDYLAKWTKTSVRQIQRILDKLCQKGYIQKKDKYENNKHFCSYRTVNLHDTMTCKSETYTTPCQTYTTSCQTYTTPCRNLHDKMAVNNKIDNTIKEIIDNDSSMISSSKKILAEFKSEKEIHFSEKIEKEIIKRLDEINEGKNFVEYAWKSCIKTYPNKDKNEITKLWISAILTWDSLLKDFENFQKMEEEKNDPWKKWEKINPPKVCKCGAKLYPPTKNQYGEIECECGNCGEKAIFDFYAEGGWIWT